MQKTNNTDCPCDDRVELESTKGVQSTNPAETEVKDGADDLLDRLLTDENLNRAYKKVKKNGGAAGIDKMTVKEALPYLKEHGEEIRNRIRKGRYKPSPVRRVEIPKPDGGVRLLGVPTVVDRIIQQALVQVLTPVFEPTFSDSSYGFRPKRSAHQAMAKAVEHYNDGYHWVVDIDLEKYFDTVNHEILMDMIMNEVKERPVIKLIRAFLKSGVMADGIVKPTDEGTPQGGNLSPLLSNIYLSRFDKMLEERGHRFVRYADDCNIFLKSKRAAERVMDNSVEFLEGKKMMLTVNREKSNTSHATKVKFLGFSMYAKSKGKAGIRVHQKSMIRFKKRIREITKRNRGRNFRTMLVELKRFTVGWINYYQIADMKTFMDEANQWIRRRLRMYIWKQWKKISAKFRNLQKLGISKDQAWQWSNSRKGYWRIAGSAVLKRAITNESLVKAGYLDIFAYYEAKHLSY